MESQNATKTQFDELAESWDEDPKRIIFTKAIADSIKKELNLDKSTRAFEFGCGTGLVTMQMADALGSITAVDSSEKMIEQLAKKIEGSKIKNIKPIHIDFDEEDLPSGDYSLLFSNMVIHHLDDYESQLKRFHELIEPGGYIAISDLDKEDGSFHGDMEGIFHYGFERDSFIKSLEKAGFINCRVTTAFVIPRENEDGSKTEFPIFLAIGQK
ncbi:MAG: class I SAM-dependent methyltransferase [Desulfobacterales bacterium]|nr:class I SAM-dependent methyltransferase [Desulfobacterales bacterium]